MVRSCRVVAKTGVMLIQKLSLRKLNMKIRSLNFFPRNLLDYFDHVSVLTFLHTKIAKLSGSNKTQGVVVDWSNILHDLLLQIAGGLGMIELMNLCCVCKEWRNAFLKTLPKQNEPLGSDPWFLIYGSSKCSLLSSIQDRLCTATIPELDSGATCLASHQGWLLVFRGGSAFFFCPFSMAKIDLPSFPFTEISGIAAAFSAPPTSQDCKVVVIRRCSEVELELHLLSRGHDTWVKQNYDCGVLTLNTIAAALFSEGAFHFFDNFQGLVTFDAAAAAETQKWKRFRFIVRPPGSQLTPGGLTVNYRRRRGTFGKNHFKKLGLDENRVSISTCGTLYPDSNGKWDVAIPGESIGKGMDTKNRHQLIKGVWIMPRYHKPNMDQRW